MRRIGGRLGVRARRALLADHHVPFGMTVASAHASAARADVPLRQSAGGDSLTLTFEGVKNPALGRFNSQAGVEFSFAKHTAAGVRCHIERN